MAKLSLAKAQIEYAGRLKLLELDVQQAQLVHDQAQTALAKAMEIGDKALSETEAAARRAAVEQSRIELERARTNLELHQKSNAPEVESSGPRPK